MTSASIVPASQPTAALAHPVELGASARAFAVESHSPRTRAAYRAQWERFAVWCDAQGVDCLPAAPEAVANFVGELARKKDEGGHGLRVATISQALAAIGLAHKLAGARSPVAAPVVVSTWKGIRRTLGVAPKQKAPVLVSQLQAMVGELPDNLRGIRDRALLLVGWAGAFRRSELVALTVADVAFGPEGVTVALRRSKTDQEGKGRTVGLPYGKSSATCPVRALRAWLNAAGLEDGPLFRSVGRYGRVGGALSGRDVARLVKAAAAAAGMDPAVFAGHSLRAGLATSAAQHGASAHVIAKQTGHKSMDMVARYIRDAELFKDNATNGLL